VNYCNLGTYQEHELQQRKNFKLASYTVRLAVEDLFNSVIEERIVERQFRQETMMLMT